MKETCVLTCADCSLCHSLPQHPGSLAFAPKSSQALPRLVCGARVLLLVCALLPPGGNGDNCSTGALWGQEGLAAAGEPEVGETRPYSHFLFSGPQRLEMEENSERSKAATQMEGVIIIITMIIVIKIIMLAWKVLYKAGLFMSACCLCLRHFIFAHNN